MAYGSLGSARAISGKGTGLTPRPGSMPSVGANHGGKLGCATAVSQMSSRGLQVSACSRGGSGVGVQKEPKWGGRATGES